jgi:hypothetical protein
MIRTLSYAADSTHNNLLYDRHLLNAHSPMQTANNYYSETAAGSGSGSASGSVRGGSSEAWARRLTELRCLSGRLWVKSEQAAKIAIEFPDTAVSSTDSTTFRQVSVGPLFLWDLSYVMCNVFHSLLNS